MSEPVGLIGLGLMGTAFARRLHDAGFAAVGYDIDPARCAALENLGGTLAESVADVARRCRIIVAAVLTVGQLEEVVSGPGGIMEACGAAQADIVILCTGTYEPDRIEVLSEKVAGTGIAIVDAPVSGTSRQVLQGDGLGLVGGDRSAVAAAAPVLDVLYPRREDTGAVGSGTRTKLAINHVLGLNRVALAEGLVFAERLGLDKATFLDVARKSAAYSQIMDVKGPKMVQGDYTPVSKVSQHLKDVRIMVEEARRRGQALPFASLLVDVLEACERNGDGERDNAIAIEEIRRRSTS